MLLYHDPNKGNLGMLDEMPMPLVLYIHTGENGELIFEQTEHTKKYLGIGS